MAISFLARIVEERIREAQKAGAFDGLTGQGKPLELKEDGWVPAELRVAYRILKNANLLPPEVELRKEIHGLWDLLKTVDGEGERRAILKDIEERVVRLDLMRRRSMPAGAVRSYTKKILAKLYPSLHAKALPHKVR